MTKALTKGISKLYKSYLFTIVVKDLKKLADMDLKKQARRMMKNVDWDKKYWLRKAGLTTYTPVKSTVGSGMLFVLGAAVGAMAGLALAPSRGEDFRRNLRGKATEFMGKHEEMGQTQAPAQA